MSNLARAGSVDGRHSGRSVRPERGELNKTRAVVERVIAHFKTWRILHTDYRRPLSTFRETISAVVALHLYSLA